VKTSVSTPPGIGKSWLVVLVAAAVAWTALCLRYASTQGRLAQPPVFDDVAYLMDGARRAAALHTGGVSGLVSDLRARAPKSPYSTIAATTAFLVIGPETWAPYLSNVLVVLALLYVTARAARGAGLPAWAAVGVALLVLRLPIAQKAAAEFRPDLLSGLLATIGVLAALEGGGGAWRRFRVGMWFGASIFAKPTATPAVLVLWAAAMGAGLLIEAFDRRPQHPVGWCTGGMLASLAGVTVLPALYAPVGAEFTWKYIEFNLWGPGLALWLRDMSLLDQVLFYITGPGGDFMFGSLGLLLVALALMDLLLGLGRGAAAPQRLRVAASFAVLLLTYAIVVRTPIKNVYFGAQFDAMLVALAARGLARVLALWPRAGALRVGLAVRGGVLAALAVASACTFVMPGRFPSANPRWRSEVNGLYDGIYEQVRGRVPPGRPSKVFLTFTGIINSANLQYRAYLDRLPITIESAEMMDKPEKYARRIEQADLVLALPEGTSHDIGRFPSLQMLDDALAYLDSRPDLVRVATFPIRVSKGRDAPGKYPPEYVLFAKRDAVTPPPAR
jgi:hypothetical protein